jgi:hypothetical protein
MSRIMDSIHVHALANDNVDTDGETGQRDYALL